MSLSVDALFAEPRLRVGSCAGPRPGLQDEQVTSLLYGIQIRSVLLLDSLTRPYPPLLCRFASGDYRHFWPPLDEGWAAACPLSAHTEGPQHLCIRDRPDGTCGGSGSPSCPGCQVQMNDHVWGREYASWRGWEWGH